MLKLMRLLTLMVTLFICAPIHANQDNYAGSYLAGRHAANYGDFDHAYLYLKRSLATDPDNLKLLQHVFSLAIASENYQEALSYAERIIKQTPDDYSVNFFLFIHYFKNKNFEQSRKYIDALVKKHNLSVIKVLKAWQLAAEGEIKKEKALFSELEKAEKTNTLLHTNFAHFYILNQQIDEATKYYDLALKNTKYIDINLHYSYSFFLAHQMQSESLLNYWESLNPPAKIRELFGPIIEKAHQGQSIKMPVENKNDALSFFMGIVGAELQKNYNPIGREFIHMANYLAPDFPVTKFRMIEFYRFLESPHKVLTYTKKITKDEIFYNDAKLIEAKILFTQNQNNKGVKLLKTLISEDRVVGRAYTSLGDFKRYDHKFSEAIPYYLKAEEYYNPIGKDNWFILYVLGICYERTKNFDAAEKYFLRALEIVPEHPDVLNYLAYTWIENGKNLKKAFDMLELAVKKRPKDGFILDSLGWAYFKMKNYPQAVYYLEKAISFEAGDPIINDHMGDAYWQVGRVREAKFFWQKALKLNPDKDLKKQIESKIKNGLH